MTDDQRIENSQGKIFYGMHFYPGVARYDDPAQKKSLTVFINEDTIRKMGPTFAAKPIFVEHVDEVDQDINELRKEADGWVVESFFNEVDGKHWVKFIIVTDQALRAIQNGFRLSNAYIPQLTPKHGVWNGVPYQQQVMGGEYEHLAIVQHPRYEESVIMDPEEFKQYNAAQAVELTKLKNSKSKGETTMSFKLFKRTKVENSADLAGMHVELPKSKKEMALEEVIAGYDKFLNMSGYADESHMVKVGENEMSVGDLVKAHQKACNDIESLKKAHEEEGRQIDDENDPAAENDSEQEIEDAGMADVGDRGGDKHLANEEEDDDTEEAKKKKDKMKNKLKNKANLDEEDEEFAKAILSRIKAKKLKNANLRNARRDDEEGPSVIDTAVDQVARGRQRYGSGN